MYILVWVIVSLTYGPTTAAGTQQFVNEKACVEAMNFMTDQGDHERVKVQALCVEDKR